MYIILSLKYYYNIHWMFVITLFKQLLKCINNVGTYTYILPTNLVTNKNRYTLVTLYFLQSQRLKIHHVPIINFSLLNKVS